MITLFGQARSRAARSLWMLEEIDVPYEHVPTAPYTESRAPDYLRINPNGHIPSLDDSGFILWESLAINLYLAESYASEPFWPADVKNRALVYQWSFWAATGIEPRIVSVSPPHSACWMIHSVIGPTSWAKRSQLPTSIWPRQSVSQGKRASQA